jgi:hypothetical protein
MPVIIEANYQKRLGLPGYSSHSYAVTIRTELIDLSQVERESSKMYALLQGAVDREIVESGFVPDPITGNGSTTPRTTNGHAAQSNGDAWTCSDKQRELILRIKDEHKLGQEDIETIAKQLFQRPAKTLNKLEASVLINELLEEFGPKKANSNGRTYQSGARR